MSTLRSKLLARDGFVLLYGTTPPRSGSSNDQIAAAAEKLARRVERLPLDGFVVYDLQDENSRTNAPRPFPFVQSVDSRGYSRLLLGLTAKPAICYKCIGRLTEAQWQDWLDETGADYAIEILSLVGRPTSRGAQYPMSLPKAYALAASHAAGFTLGGVVIAERHSASTSESRRMLVKAEQGCSFFVSQAVYRPETTIGMLSDYWHDCQRQGAAPKRVVLTFTPCGRKRTMAFMKWLGIEIPPATERAILADPSPLARSIEICRSNLQQILDQPYAEHLLLGINAESVSINKDEIDASVDLFYALRGVLDERSGTTQRA